MKKEEFNLKRSTLNLVISQLRSSLVNEELRKRAAYATLAAVNCRIFAAQEELNGIKYGESFYKERHHASPQPLTRVVRRSDLRTVRKERSAVSSNRRLFVYSPDY